MLMQVMRLHSRANLSSKLITKKYIRIFLPQNEKAAQ